MKQLIFLLAWISLGVVTVALMHETSAEETANDSKGSATLLPDKVDIKKNGRIWVNGARAFITLLYDGTQLPLRSEHILASAGKNPGLYLSVYPDGLPTDRALTKRMVVIDVIGTMVRRSNVLDTGLDFEWGDNNYVKFDHNTMYFGIYSPKRMQFVYHNGKLEENKGPWRGPAEPEKYLEPDEPGPCYNVADVPACIAEVEQAEAAERAKMKRNYKPSVRKAKPSATK
jgi:hypothetical protein